MPGAIHRPGPAAMSWGSSRTGRPTARPGRPATATGSARRSWSDSADSRSRSWIVHSQGIARPKNGCPTGTFARSQPAPRQPAKPSPAQPTSGQAKPSQPASGQAFSLSELKITNGQVAITDEQKHQSRAVYDHIDLALSNYAAGKPFDLSLAAHLPGQGDQYVKFDGTAGPMNDQNSLATPLDGRLKLNQVSLAGLQKFLNSPQLNQYEMVASGDASVRNNNHAGRRPDSVPRLHGQPAAE